MALITPTTKEINDNIINQLEAALNQTIPLLPKAFNRVLAKALAGIFILIYKYAGWMFLQIFVRTASFQETEILGKKITPLIEWGRLIGVGDPNPATQAELLIDITVENQTGSLDAGTQLFSSINGITYLLIDSVLLDAPIVQGEIRAQSDIDGNLGAGTIGNLNPLDIVSFVNPQTNVARDTIVDSQIVVGVDGETEENYRQRIIDRFQKRPQGGAGVDYVIWGEEVENIINIYPYTGDPGFVDVYVESTEPDGIPTPAQLDAVKQSITFDAEGQQTRKPVNAFLNTYPIIRVGFEITVYDLDVDDPSTIEQNIEDFIEQYFLEREPYIVGVTPSPRKDIITIQNISAIVDDIVSSVNGLFSDVTMRISGEELDISNYYLQIGEKSKLSLITFVSS